MPLKYPTHHALGGTAMDGGLEQNEDELLMLTEFIKKKGIKNYLEIGIAKGDLMRYMIDLGLDCTGITPHVQGAHAGLNVYYGKSQDPKFPQLFSDLGLKFDLIFVDGDHSYEAVKADYENYKGLCKYMAFHDILGQRDCEGVAQLWDELKEKHKHLEFISDNLKYASGIGVIYLTPSEQYQK